VKRGESSGRGLACWKGASGEFKEDEGLRDRGKKKMRTEPVWLSEGNSWEGGGGGRKLLLKEGKVSAGLKLETGKRAAKRSGKKKKKKLARQGEKAVHAPERLPGTHDHVCEGNIKDASA